ncbi:MAG: divergent polysaccharide deacetylase family protein [Gammaproteobacteria bacterium]|nr:divergent polysaccharide deacetylase family protein [Gammaproteobacteria bacterium]
MADFRYHIVLLVLLAGSAVAESIEPPGRIAIIIDDIGYQLTAGRRALQLPGPIAFAVLPQTPRGRMLARQAHERGKEVLLHLPLEAIPTETALTPDPGGLTLDMSRRQFSSMFDSSLQSVPHVIGINNHRGSLLTRHPGHMSWLMEEINSRGNLFFVDSFTTHQSVALDIAVEAGVPAVKRDVFLDPDETEETLQREFARLIQLARRRGLAVGIGHPYPTTLDFLERELPRLADDNIELISISEMVSLKSNRKTSRCTKSRYRPGAENAMTGGTTTACNTL